MSTLIFAVCTTHIALFSTHTNIQESSEIIEQENPHTSGYKLNWIENGVLICDENIGRGDIKICSDVLGDAI